VLHLIQNQIFISGKFDKIKIMRDNSNTFMYVVAGIILLHFIAGFIWLIIKLSKKKDDK
jgi:hypothetical protein